MSISQLHTKIDLVKAFIQFEGNISINGTCYNFDKNGGIEFSGYTGSHTRKITMDKYQVEALDNCKTIKEIYECYKEMSYF
ncbi:hypothetical protein P4637_03390 [Halalkalibacterium halodurans]|uniref:hypothetical protein n=1 Tax=Halalkalibacterium halodurans TaxID=86665 RepID=UPI002E20D175|nr:hypothetical protein [Halalkalibacterium halodurans]MED4105543.1 hypothetical protein [Halalkalibacterium halodurans]MED4109251.1 hypothetical protein [Halalkalibacterium halodurans]MED4149735.1 hypothetical protein [Halalkalibacterium halodurans]